MNDAAKHRELIGRLDQIIKLLTEIAYPSKITVSYPREITYDLCSTLPTAEEREG